MMSKKMLASLTLAFLTVVAVAAVFFTWGGPQVAAASCDIGSLRDFAVAAHKQGDDTTGRYRDQEAEACLNHGNGGSAAPSSSKEETLSSTTAPPAPSSTADKGAGTNGNEHPYEFLANRPVDEKVALNAFGPKVALVAAFKGKDMGTLTTEESVQEHAYRRTVDPMQTATQAASLELIKGEEVDAKTKLYASDFKARDDMNTKIQQRFDAMEKSVYVVKAGTKLSAQYALPGKSRDEAPLVTTDPDFSYPYDIHVLSYKDKDGKVYEYREECGYQFLGRVPGIKAMPAPSPGMTRTPEGTPTPKPPPSTSTTPSTPGTTQSTPGTTTPPVTTTTPSTPVCTPPKGHSCESKTSAPQPSGVEHPSSNPISSLQPTRPTQSDPLGTEPAHPTTTTRVVPTGVTGAPGSSQPASSSHIPDPQPGQ